MFVMFLMFVMYVMYVMFIIILKSVMSAISAFGDGQSRSLRATAQSLTTRLATTGQGRTLRATAQSLTMRLATGQGHTMRATGQSCKAVRFRRQRKKKSLNKSEGRSVESSTTEQSLPRITTEKSPRAQRRVSI
jgi:hypothetical protein